MTEFLLSRFVKGYPEVNDPQVRARCGNLAGLVGICCNLLLSAGKFLAGLLTGSVAISADAVNNLSDASSSIITLLGFRLAARPADDEPLWTRTHRISLGTGCERDDPAHRR